MPVVVNKVSVHDIRTVLPRILLVFLGGAAITLFSPPAGEPTNRGNHQLNSQPAG